MNLINTILLVEDDKAIRKTLADFLDEFGGFTVYQAQNGEEGLEIWETFVKIIDLVITDYHMPVMDGLGMVKDARRAGLATRVIMMSGEYEPTADELLLLSNFIEKPFEFIDLLKKIESLEN